MLAKNFETKFAGEEEQPNANKASTCDSNVERQISSSCDEVAIPSLSEEATVNSEASAPLGEDSAEERRATKLGGGISPLLPINNFMRVNFDIIII